MGRAALLHQDRDEPRIGGPASQQRGQHRRPQPGVQVVDVRLQHPHLRRRRCRPVRGTEHHADDIGPPRGVAGARPDPDRRDRERRQRAAVVGEGAQESHAGRRGELALAARADLPAPGELEDRGRRHRQVAVRRADASGPHRHRARRDAADARSASAAHTPTMSAIASHDPTSWNATSSGGMPCTRPSASASRAKTASAGSLIVMGRSADSSSVRIRDNERCGRSSPRLSTSTLSARSPARLTVLARTATSPGTTAPTADLTASREAPASSSAPSSMSPAMPAEASTHRCAAASAVMPERYGAVTVPVPGPADALDGWLRALGTTVSRSGCGRVR